MNKITQEQFDKAYKLHSRFLRGLKTGVKMDFSDCDLTDIRFPERADLRRADLQWANLRGADLRRADLQWANLRGADLQWADLQWADLQWADLQWADLQWADLQGANLDYSVWPLWCGSQDVTIDERLLYQLIAHVCAVNVSDSKDFQDIKGFLLQYARKSHVYNHLKGSIEKEQEHE